MPHISNQTSAEISHIGGLNQPMMTSWIAYPAEVLKPVPKKKYTATFYSSRDVDPMFYDTMLIVTDPWVKYAKDYDSIDDVKFPVGSHILEVVEGEAE